MARPKPVRKEESLMFLKFRGYRMIWMLILVVAVIAGCGRKPKPAMAPPPEPAQRTETETVTPADPVERAEVLFQDVFFDYDRHIVRPDQTETLAQNARLLSENGGVRLLLEGHCDERGTVEYNLALGDRRAQSVRNYLVEYGIDPGRLTTISYGKERPFAMGSSETAWAQNRRVHFVKK